MFLSFGFWSGRGRNDDSGGSSSHSSAAGGDLSAGRLAFKLGLASIGSIFVAALVAYVTIRLRADVWREAEHPGLPAILWLSTGLLAVTSVAAEAAYRGAPAKMAQRLVIGFGAAIVFCITQFLAWAQWSSAGLPPSAPTLYAFSFYLLTALHGLHVLGGVVVNYIAWRKAKAKRLRLRNRRSEFVRFTAQYWHFLGVVWIVTWITLEIGAAT